MDTENLYQHIRELQWQQNRMLAVLDKLKPGVVCWRSNCESNASVLFPVRVAPHMKDEYCRQPQWTEKPK